MVTTAASSVVCTLDANMSAASGIEYSVAPQMNTLDHGEMSTTERQLTEPAVQPQLYAVDRPEELTHMVCCRDHSWSRALCGAGTLDYINMGAQFICSMCIEVYQELIAAMPQPQPDDTCPIDGCSCPTDRELEEIVRRRLES